MKVAVVGYPNVGKSSLVKAAQPRRWVAFKPTELPRSCTASELEASQT